MWTGSTSLLKKSETRSIQQLMETELLLQHN
jgi:hypothetical protein